MHVCRLHGIGRLLIHQEPLPSPRDGEALIRVEAVGVCGSDLHWFDEGGIGDAVLKRPLVLGHEFAGTAMSGRHKGRLVAVDPAVPCETCDLCRAGHPNLCEGVDFAGHGTTDGALREFMTWPERCLFPVPEGFTASDAALLEPLGVAIHAVDLAHLKPASRIGVFGAGPIGLMIMDVARSAGAVHIMATDILPHRIEAARAHAHEVWDAGTLETGILKDMALDVVFEAAGKNEAVEQAIEAVRPGGKVVLVGIPSDDRTSFTASIARRKGISIIMVRRMKHVYPRAIALVQEGRVDVRHLATHHFGLQDAVQAFQTAARREGLKTVIVPYSANG